MLCGLKRSLSVVLLSWSSPGLQRLITSMQDFCSHMGLTISSSKTEVMVFNGSSTDTWLLGDYALPRSTTFKYLGLIFHESGDVSPAFARLAQNGRGASARLREKIKKLMCDTSLPMMRRLFDAVVLPTVSYGSEVWAPECSKPFGSELRAMMNIQVTFFRQLCHLRKGVSSEIIFKELAEQPWPQIWWSRVLGFMYRLSQMPEDSLHLDVLKDNLYDAQQTSHCMNWAKGIAKQFQILGLPSPFSATGIGSIDGQEFRAALIRRQQRIWENVAESPRTAPSKGAKLCTYHRWFSPPDRLHSAPYHQLPMPITKLRALLQFRMGSHALPVEQGRFARPVVPRNLRRCTLCSTRSVGDERHYLLECPNFDEVRAQYAELFDSSAGAMRSFVWHKDQQAVCDYMTAVIRLAET